MNQKGDLALKVTSKYAMGQINSSFSGSSGVIFFIIQTPFYRQGAHSGCANNLRYPVAERLATLRGLSTFEVAARHESFALAADELALTPSAVSHRINQLEEELGIQLFVRSHRKVELTREGKRVYWALKASLDGLNQEILDIKNQELSGSLTVYSRPSIAQCWLVPALGDFSRRYPAISLTVLTGNDNVNLQRAGIDLAIYFDDAPSSQLSHHFLMDEAIVPVCTPYYARQLQLTSNPASLRHCTLLHDRRGMEQ